MMQFNLSSMIQKVQGLDELMVPFEKKGDG
jgi:hypothetical protein